MYTYAIVIVYLYYTIYLYNIYTWISAYFHITHYLILCRIFCLMWNKTQFYFVWRHWENTHVILIALQDNKNICRLNITRQLLSKQLPHYMALSQLTTCWTPPLPSSKRGFKYPPWISVFVPKCYAMFWNIR